MRGNARLPGFALGPVEGGLVEEPADQERVLIRMRPPIGARCEPAVRRRVSGLKCRPESLLRFGPAGNSATRVQCNGHVGAYKWK